MPIRIVDHGGLYTAEVTPPTGGAPSWRSPEPMREAELIAALRNIGCNPRDITQAFWQISLQHYQELAEAMSPLVKAVLSGETEVPTAAPFTEAWLTLSIFLGPNPMPLADVIEGADYIWHSIPTPELVAWALLQLKRRGWLLLQGNSYGLTPEARRTIESILGNGEGGVLKGVGRLKEWVSSHQPPVGR